MSVKNELLLNRIEMKTIFGFDLGVFLENDNCRNKFNSFRGNRKWLGSLLKHIKASKQHHGFDSPDFVTSGYAMTDKRERSTFSTYYSNTLMPLEFSICDDKPLHLEHSICVEFQTVKIGINGSITLTSKSSYHGTGLSCDIFIKMYNNIILSRIKEKAHSIIGQLIEILKSHMVFVSTNLSFNQITATKFNESISCFEVLDFDYTISKQKDINNLCKDESLFKQLIRMSRMSPSSYQNHNIERIKRFKNDNVGNRNDELWLINENRIIRHYPKACGKSKDLFFNDVILGCEIFIQYKVASLYLNQWLITKYSEIKETINSKNKSTPKNLNGLETIIFEMTNFIDIFSDDFYVQMNINHSFFNEVMKYLIKKLDLMSILKSNRELLSSLLQQLSSISSIITTDKSIKTNKIMEHITYIMAFVAIMQLIIAFMTLMIMLDK